MRKLAGILGFAEVTRYPRAVGGFTFQRSALFPVATVDLWLLRPGSCASRLWVLVLYYFRALRDPRGRLLPVVVGRQLLPIRVLRRTSSVLLGRRPIHR